MVFALKIKFRYHWRMLKANTAFKLIRWAGKADGRALKMFAWNYTDATFDEFQVWCWEKMRNG